MLYVMLRSVGIRGDEVAALRHLESPLAWLCRISFAYRSAGSDTRVTPTVSELASNVQRYWLNKFLGTTKN
jgi:hypothetical protein